VPDLRHRRLRLIVNGKAAADSALRAAVGTLRREGCGIDVRVTWEAGDAAGFAAEAAADGAEVVVAAGGDGTVNEVADGMLSSADVDGPALAVLPYGTANDFATSCGIARGEPLPALRLAIESEPRAIDVGRVNGRHFLNVASGGFGAEVTANTPVEMKRALGSAAYSLMGVVTAAKMTPYECRFLLPDGKAHDGRMLVLAVGNGRQCGGGFQVTPRALLDDGLLDVLIVHDVEIAQLGLVLNELISLGRENHQFIDYVQVPSLEITSVEPIQLNLDGEPLRDARFQFDLLPRRLRVMLPPGAPVVDDARG
jgi:lipid kinase YegS